MIDGATYYDNQSQARGIRGVEDVRRMAAGEALVFDRLILSHLRNRDARVYEAATGPGILQAWLQSRGFHKLHGSDFSANEARMAEVITPGIVHADSVADLEERFGENSLDAIIALDFFEHIPRERFRDFMRIAVSRLAPGGVLIMRGPNGDTPFVGLNLYNDITHVWAYTTVCLRALLGLSGFSRVSFADDTIDGLHHGRWWKRCFMKPAQMLLEALCWAATRQRVRYWGMSLYVYAYKPKAIS